MRRRRIPELVRVFIPENIDSFEFEDYPASQKEVVQERLQSNLDDAQDAQENEGEDHARETD